MNRRIAAHIREAAVSDAPCPVFDGYCLPADWIGRAHQWVAVHRLVGNEAFRFADEEHQRTFLLFVAEDLS